MVPSKVVKKCTQGIKSYRDLNTRALNNSYLET
jgi:hypothetical protein